MSRPLQHPDRFVRRHVGAGDEDVRSMLEALGLPSLEALVAETVPASIRLGRPLALPAAATESEALHELEALAAKNVKARSFLGQGYQTCLVPPVVQRNVFENPGWYTAYTPYQAEIAQGRLEALLNWQTVVTDLTGMALSNASLLDEGTAAAEAMTMLRAVNGKAGEAFFVDQACHPQTIDVVLGRARPLGIAVTVGDAKAATFEGGKFFGVLTAYPTTTGEVPDLAALTAKAHAAGAKVAVATDLLALTILVPPGELGADVVLGNAQRFGIPLGFGGPHAAFFATKTEWARSMPGRIIGMSKDARGKPALRMALQTREQHIRREKATSNICTAQVLLAVMSGFYAVWHGPDGLRAIGEHVHAMAGTLAAAAVKSGLTLVHERFFDTLALRGKDGAAIAAILHRAAGAKVNLRRLDDRTIGIALDEATTEAELHTLVGILGGAPAAELPAPIGALPAAARRTSKYLTHPVFSAHRSETEMLRYLRSLEAKDLSLTHSMIALGSCTMKLNATSQMFPVSWGALADVHPFAPADQVQGWHELFGQLEGWLAEITGFHATSLQPNAGSQGEYAGLLVIRAYHEARGEPQRDVCLIPQSAHGTNPASAALAGLRVVVVKCDEKGNVDVADLKARAKEHESKLCALMITYPSTHGVFEEAVREICEVVHAHGGQVYMDGANMNAQVGLCRPGDFGPDVCHLNLHKTFAIPHGGGGPGMGPICVARHLAPFLPGHPLAKTGGEKGIHAISSGPWGSASILVIPWMYIRTLGPEGVAHATKLAILNANYVAKKLSAHYPLLYSGSHGRIAHECILDFRPLKKSAGIEVEDVAKRLMDYGFHAPTVSFPVAGTIMVEPTESEPRAELDRFIDALARIRAEIAEVEAGTLPRDDNPLVNAPHPPESVTADEWKHAYGRERAAYPAPWVRTHKFWPSVARVDGVYGDRNLVCSCPPIEAYAER